VPPIFSTGPILARRLCHIDGVPTAIDANPEISAERKAFLKERVSYWKEWSSSAGTKYVVLSRDCE
jgi:hypothetical protein